MLEFYNHPIAFIEKEPELKDGIRSIFVDMTDWGSMFSATKVMVLKEKRVHEAYFSPFTLPFYHFMITFDAKKVKNRI